MKKIFLTACLYLVALFFAHCTGDAKTEMFQTFKQGVSADVFALLPFSTSQDMVKATYMRTVAPALFERFGYCGFDVIYTYNKEQFTKATNYLDSKKIAVYSSEDNCRIVLPDPEYTHKMNCSGVYYPVPPAYFPNIDPNTKKDNMVSTTNLKYYVLTYKEGVFVNGADTLQPRATRPDLRGNTFPHGFTNGAIVDSQKLRIDYWILIW